MKAITTRYIGPTEHRPARIIATDGDGNRITIPASLDGASGVDAHTHAVRALCYQRDWYGTLVRGALNRHGVQVWVWLDLTHKVGHVPATCTAWNAIEV